MNQYEVIIEPSAEDDLKSIYDYISDKLQSKINAKKSLRKN